MKKNILTILLLGLLVSCNNANSTIISEDTSSNEETSSSEDSSILIQESSTVANYDPISVLCPTGAPSLAFYNHLDDNNFTTNSNPANIVSSMTKNGTDLVVIDLLKGVQAINNGAPYKLASCLTFGNFYIASTGNDTNETMDKDDNIIIFGKGQTPDYLFKYLYGEDYTNIEYVDNVQAAAKCLISGKNADMSKDVSYVFIAQPVLLQAMSQNEKVKVYANIQDLYYEKSQSSMFQAGLFVKNDLVNKDVNTYLSTLESDVNLLLGKDSETLNKINSYDDDAFTNKYGVKKQIVEKTIDKNLMGLGFKYVSEVKNDVNKFLKIFNLEIKDENIYQK